MLFDGRLPLTFPKISTTQQAEIIPAEQIWIKTRLTSLQNVMIHEMGQVQTLFITAIVSDSLEELTFRSSEQRKFECVALVDQPLCTPTKCGQSTNNDLNVSEILVKSFHSCLFKSKVWIHLQIRPSQISGCPRPKIGQIRKWSKF